MYHFCLLCQPVLQHKPSADLDLSTEVATRLNLVDREPPAVVLPDAHAWHSDEDIPRLTKVGGSGGWCGRGGQEIMPLISFMCLFLCVGYGSRGELCAGSA